jgi:MFS family permease
MNLAGFTVNSLDIYPNNSGQMMSITNTAAQIPGIIGNIVTGEILESTGSWVSVFLVASAFAAFGTLVL